MIPADIRAKLTNHIHVMYRDLTDVQEKRLRTGDVVCLNLDDFKSILKNYELLEPLLRSYDSSEKYKSKLWAVLNKPCDMVHEGTQKFKSSSLFLAPLQSFLGELRKDRIFADYVLPPATVAPLKDFLSGHTKSYFSKLAVKTIVCPADATLEERKLIKPRRIDFQVEHSEWLEEEVFKDIKETETPDLVEKIFGQFAATPEIAQIQGICDYLTNFATDADWLAYKAEYEKSVKEQNEVHLDPGEKEELSKNVFTNQMELRGRFYYEPHLNLYSEEVNDFSYVIELEDLITLKVSEASIKDGTLVELLKTRRLVGLSRNYSDRLQNIMGYYYSKIGTADVQSKVVVALYDECFDNFFP